MVAGKKVDVEEDVYNMKKIEVVSKDEHMLSLIMSGVTATEVNAIRRAIIDLVPVMAIEGLEIKKNTSILYDEMVAHRMGLLPLTTDLKSYTLPEKCTCKGEGCAKCQLQLTLKAKGPKVVYASDIKSKDPKVIPVHPKTPIVKLAEGQEIELVATAILGRGSEHAKWSSGNAWYINKPTIKVNNQSKSFEELKDKYPPQIFDSKGKIDAKLINKPSLIDACDGVCDDIVKFDFDEKAFIFYIESWGQLSPKNTLIQATRELSMSAEELGKDIKNIK